MAEDEEKHYAVALYMREPLEAHQTAIDKACENLEARLGEVGHEAVNALKEELHQALLPLVVAMTKACEQLEADLY